MGALHSARRLHQHSHARDNDFATLCLVSISLQIWLSQQDGHALHRQHEHCTRAVRQPTCVLRLRSAHTAFTTSTTDLEMCRPMYAKKLHPSTCPRTKGSVGGQQETAKTRQLHMKRNTRTKHQCAPPKNSNRNGKQLANTWYP